MLRGRLFGRELATLALDIGVLVASEWTALLSIRFLNKVVICFGVVTEERWLPVFVKSATRHYLLTTLQLGFALTHALVLEGYRWCPPFMLAARVFSVRVEPCMWPAVSYMSPTCCSGTLTLRSGFVALARRWRLTVRST